MSFKFRQCGTHFCPIVDLPSYLKLFLPNLMVLNLGTVIGTAAIDSYQVYISVNNSFSLIILYTSHMAVLKRPKYIFRIPALSLNSLYDDWKSQYKVLYS